MNRFSWMISLTAVLCSCTKSQEHKDKNCETDHPVTSEAQGTFSFQGFGSPCESFADSPLTPSHVNRALEIAGQAIQEETPQTETGKLPGRLVGGGIGRYTIDENLERGHSSSSHDSALSSQLQDSCKSNRSQGSVKGHSAPCTPLQDNPLYRGSNCESDTLSTRASLLSHSHSTKLSPLSSDPRKENREYPRETTPTSRLRQPKGVSPSLRRLHIHQNNTVEPDTACASAEIDVD